MNVNVEITISSFKSLLLSYFGSEPFFLEYNIDNSMLVSDLIDLIEKDKENKNKKVVNVYFDIRSLRIKLRNEENQIFQLSNLSYDNSLQELNERIQNLD